MADASDSEFPQDSSSSHSDRDGYVQQWNALCEELGTSDPNEVLARVQTLKREMEGSGDGSREDEGLVTISEVEEVFREMNRKIEKLRERNADLAERLEGDDEEVNTAFRELHRKTEHLMETLDAATMDEARERIRQLNQRLERLYKEKETLAEAGLSDAQEALDELDRVRDEREALRRERNELEEELEDMSSSSSRRPDPDTSVLEAAVVIRDRIGVSTPDQAEALTRIAEQLYKRVRGLGEAYDVAVDDRPGDFVEMLHSMAAQLNALPGPDALPSEAADVLGITSSSEAHTLADTIRRIGRRLIDQYEGAVEFEKLEAEADDAVGLLHTLEDRIQALPDSGPASSEEEGLPAEAGDILGIRSVEDAKELDDLIARVTDRLERLEEEHEQLEEVGLSVDGALMMIENMGAQLADLYENTPTGPNGTSSSESTMSLSALDEQTLERLAERTDSVPEAADDMTQVVRALVDQIDELSEEQAPLDDAGLDAEEAVTLIESMERQLNDLYTARDAEVDPEERHEARLWAPEAEPSPSEDTDETMDPVEQGEAGTLTMSSMEHQLESLYREKETLLHHGFRSAQEAVDQVQTQQKQIDALHRENHAYERQFERLNSELGTEHIPEVVELVKALETETDLSLEELRPSIPGESESTDYGVDIEAASPFVPKETLDNLDELPPSDLDRLDVGVVELGEKGRVEYLNDAALHLPGLQSINDPSEVVGQNFFLDLAPSTNNNLFFGRFRKGQRRGQIDARFPYTFTSPDEGPQTFAVHLYRRPEAESTWLLFRPA